MTRRTATSSLARLASRVLSAAVIGLVAVSLLVIPASAEDDLTINPDEVVIAEPGSLRTVAGQAVPPELQGRTCDLRVVAKNGASVHPGNTIIITTGTSRVEIPGVEDQSDGTINAAQAVELGETLQVDLLMGPDGLSSLGFTIGVDCGQPPPVAPVTTDPPVLPAVQVAPPPAAPVEPAPEPAAPALPAAPPAEASVGHPTFTG